MAVKPLNARIAHKHDTQANWELATSFVPLKGEVIVYDADANNTHARFKIGDGSTTVSNLPFVGELPAVSESDNGKVLIVSNGQWAAGTEPAPALVQLSVTENGRYTTDPPYVGFDVVDVYVSGGTSQLSELHVTDNGYYTPEPPYDGFSSVTVEVSGETPQLTSLHATENGSYSPEEPYVGFDTVDVDVSQSTFGTLNVTENGVYHASSAGVDGFDEVNVEVSGSATLGNLSVSHNGIYHASDDGYDGYDQVVVSVEPYAFTATGTLDNPWDNTIPAGMAGMLAQAIWSGAAQATLDIDASAIGLGSYTATALIAMSSHYISFVLAEMSDGHTYSCMEVRYDDTGAMTVCAQVQAGTYTDMTPYASMMSTQLTVSTLLNPGV